MRQMAVSCRVRVREDHDVLLASQTCQSEMRRAGLGEHKQAVLDVVVRELAWNLVRHAGGGELVLGQARNPEAPDTGAPDEVVVESLDEGPGIRTLGRPGSSGLGIGLDAVHRLCRELTIVTRPGSTRIQAVLTWR